MPIEAENTKPKTGQQNKCNYTLFKIIEMCNIKINLAHIRRMRGFPNINKSNFARDMEKAYRSYSRSRSVGFIYLANSSKMY